MKKIFFVILLATTICCRETNSDTAAIDTPKAESETTLPTMDIAKERAAIEETRQKFQQAIKEKRYGDLKQYSTADFIGVSPGSEEWMEYKRIREKPKGQFSYDSIIMRPQETVIVSDTVAYDFGTSSVYYTNAEGESVELTDTFLVILKKDLSNGKWKIHREVASAIVE